MLSIKCYRLPFAISSYQVLGVQQTLFGMKATKNWRCCFWTTDSLIQWSELSILFCNRSDHRKVPLWICLHRHFKWRRIYLPVYTLLRPLCKWHLDDEMGDPLWVTGEVHHVCRDSLLHGGFDSFLNESQMLTVHILHGLILPGSPKIPWINQRDSMMCWCINELAVPEARLRMFFRSLHSLSSTYAFLPWTMKK